MKNNLNDTAVDKLNPSCFKGVYDTYWPVLYLHACKMLQDEDEAKDIVQDLFIHIWENKEQINFSQIRPYLYVSLRNRIINRYAHAKVKDRYIDSIKHLSDHLQLHHHVEEALLYKELENNIEEGINLLPERMQEIFRMSRDAQLSHSEIAEHLNISPHTVKKTINRALKVIRTKISLLTILFS